MNLIDETVTHKVFGEGQIVEQTETSVTVDFDEDVKRFVYPDAFQTFIQLRDEQLSERLTASLSQWKKEKEVIRAKKEEEREQRMLRQQLRSRLKHEQVHESSQIVFWLEEEEVESVLQQWEVTTGTVQSGKKKGMPNRAARLRPNSVALLTVRGSEEDEADRRIVGLFMVHETFTGNTSDDGIVPSHETYRVALSEEESRQLYFWNYYMNKRSPDRMAWNSGRYRYFDNEWMAQILQDLIELRREDEEEHRQLSAFFDYFCHLNVLDPNAIPPRAGALTRA